MKVYIKEWANKTASILTDNGQVVWTFSVLQRRGRPVPTGTVGIVHSGNEELYDENTEGETPTYSLA